MNPDDASIYFNQLKIWGNLGGMLTLKRKYPDWWELLEKWNSQKINETVCILASQVLNERD